MTKKLLFALCIGLMAMSCSNNEQKESTTQDSAIATKVTADSGAKTTAKPQLSIADSVKQLEEKDTASKMIESAPASVSIHLDSIPQ
ncbi:hypothetical protein SAMN05421788_11272 [Filimonas lacunae]|uniref:Uncharacterized protein n=1 Tax=Filimonas lacunae TaxID=477680 RepID=A0A173MLJ6_9BACT|nr:hypothetical protein [Filimonas lacunae]BAV08268.1 hypothetical protein FLA_4301 [Filimonas lacunae]SIT33206.1 hypothetical protein SAMN05421788_11272 [Filimonas lacunae]